jgi:hypothetical protein
VGEYITRGFCINLKRPVERISSRLIYSTASNPSKRCDETVKELYELPWSTVPDFYSLPTWANPKGQIFRRISYDMKMISNGVTLDFEIVYNGRVVSSKNIGIDYGHCGALSSNYS